jgi:hypothetical protein
MSEYDPSKDLVLQQDWADVEAADEAHKQQQFSDSLKTNKPLSHWLWNLPANITVGSIDAVMNTADFMKETVAGSDAKGESQDPNPVVRGIMNGTYAKNALMSIRNQMAQGSNTGDELTQAVAQFLVPFAGWSKLVGGLKGMSAAGTAGKVVAAESATAATALAPDEARLADLVAYGQTLDGKIGNALRKLAPDGSLANAYIRYMTDRGDETRAEGRFKNVVDNLTAVGAVAAPLYTAAVSFKVARRMLDEGPSVLGPAAQRGSISFHGSPHKFDKFDSSKIGTGEGAQAYGHGLYFSENPDVAKYYGHTLKQDDANTFAGWAIGKFGNDKEAAIKALRSGKAVAGMNAPQHLFDQAADLIESGRYKTPGNLYNVDIPDEQIDKMLDWDAPLSDEMIKRLVDAGLPTESIARGKLGTGKDFYDSLARKSAGSSMDGQIGQRKASETLNALGIPGIKYLDQGSRAAGKGTRNFVVFDDKNLKIVKKE